MNKISRFGVYGILLGNSDILLNRKRSGPYKGLWGLPGGAIEFGETPEEALKRELLEESALSIAQLELSNIATAVGRYENQNVSYEFHHVGIIYNITSWTERSDLVPEEENRWMELNGLNLEELTPFAKHVVSNLPKNKGWRPQNTIRGKVIGVAKHKNRLLIWFRKHWE
jgi:mutator protein MutT